MKTLKLFSLLTVCMSIATLSFSQTEKTETIPVSGNCGMCKSNIEKAAKKAGASSADWDTESKKLTVKYNSSSTNTAKIQQSIAAAGYDTRDAKANDAAYDKLHSCCKYERAEKEVKPAAACCDMKDGKAQHKDACKDKDCCKDGAATKDKSCCAADKAAASVDNQAKASCCSSTAAHADGKTDKEKSCCSAAH